MSGAGLRVSGLNRAGILASTRDRLKIQAR